MQLLPAAKTSPRLARLPGAQGLFKTEKLNATVDAGNGSGSTVNRVASGTDGMGFADLAQLRVTRQATLDAAFLANPNRFKNKRPQLPSRPTAAWINPPPEEKQPPSEPASRTLN